jgi:hypothetical protein
MSASNPASGTSVRARVSGHTFTLHQHDVARALRHAEPGEIRDHFVEIGDRRYPVKQALAVATGLDPSDFTTQHARSVLRRLGLILGRLSATPSAGAARRSPAAIASHRRVPATVPHESGPEDPAAALRPYCDRWVALQRGHVVTDGASFSEVLAWLRRNDIKADAVFRVSADPTKLMAGLTS